MALLFTVVFCDCQADAGMCSYLKIRVQLWLWGFLQFMLNIYFFICFFSLSKIYSKYLILDEIVLGAW